MHVNPYQAPTAISAPEAGRDSLQSSSESDCVGSPQGAFRAYRRAVACLVLTLSLFFVLISIDMFRHMSMVDGTISLVVPIVLLMVAAKVMRWRELAESGLTRKQCSDVSKTIRQHCLWAGPALFAVGVAQMIWIPDRWHIFVCPALASGPLIFACAWLWPRLEPD